MSIVAFGSYQDPRPLTVAERVRAASETALFARDMPELQSALASTTPSCVLLDSPTQVREVSRTLRQAAHLRDIPLLVLVEKVSPRLLLSLHAEGADDVLTLGDADGLSRRLAALNERMPPKRAAPFKGECVLAHPDVARLHEFTRVLEKAGFDVLPASNTSDLLSLSQRRSPTALVISSSLPPEGGRRALRRLNEGLDRDVPAVLLAAGNPGPFSPQGWAVVAEEAPPANLLFVINDLLRPAEQLDGRESRRLLYSTQCNFRVAGELEASAGLTYNIGRGGLFVRTLSSPPRRAPLWLDLVPPGSQQAVQLRAEVAWSTAFSSAAGPAGFGAQLSPQQCAQGDLAHYVTQYSWLLELVASQSP